MREVRNPSHGEILLEGFLIPMVSGRIATRRVRNFP
jgi:hypothetical protein